MDGGESEPAPDAGALPDGWIIVVSRRYNVPYFFNTVTGETLWKPPEKVAVIVPFRDEHSKQQRKAQLDRFIPHMENLFKQGSTDYHLYIIEQSMDGRKFNRGKLLNIGYQMASAEGCSIFIFHDVDLLPSPSLYPFYSTKPKPMRPVHVARLWRRYSNNPSYMGGIVVFRGEDYDAINGYPNTFWGWGGEDDEMFKRCESLGMAMDAPPEGSGTIEDLEGMDIEAKTGLLRANRDWKCNVKWEVLAEHDATWTSNGLSSLEYEEEMTVQLSGHCTKITVDVKLNGHWTDSVQELKRGEKPPTSTGTS